MQVQHLSSAPVHLQAFVQSASLPDSSVSANVRAFRHHWRPALLYRRNQLFLPRVIPHHLQCKWAVCEFYAMVALCVTWASVVW